MSDTVAVGTRVRVHYPPKSICTRHDQRNVPTEGVTGTVIRIHAAGDHTIGVAIDLWGLGTRWTDSFRPDELEPSAPPA